MPKRTSRVLPAWRALYELLATADLFPVHPVTNERPLVSFSGQRDINLEAVIVPGRVPGGPSSQDWRTVGAPSKSERFRLEVFIWTQVPGRDALEAHDRLEDLITVVEMALRDQTTGRPTGISVAGVQQWQVAEVIPVIGPLADEGFGASCRIEVEFICSL